MSDAVVVPPPGLPLRTERLVLRAYEADDVEAVLAYNSDPSVARFLLGEPWTREGAREQVERRTHQRHVDGPDGALALVVEHEGAVIGNVVLWAADGTLSRGEVGCTVAPASGGRGLATEAVRALLDLAFDHYGMHRVRAQLDPRNTASARLCERVGMRKEAHLREDWWSKGEWTDNAVYGLLAAEHAKLRAREVSRSGTPAEQTARMSDFNTQVIEEFRANHGHVGGPFEGAPLLLLHSTGAKSGQERVHPMMYRADGASYLVFASKAGADDNPAWWHNLQANPDASIEVGDDTVAVHAQDLPRAERDEVYAAQAADYPGFADYEAKTDRVIPVVRLTPR